MPANTAVWLRKKNGGRIAVGPAPYPNPREHEIVVRNYAVAVNPADWIIAIMGGLICPWLTYPAVLGSDAAGEVVEAGRAVTRFQVGDRVLGHALGIEKNRNAAAEGAFQAYTVLLDHMTTPIPGHISYEQAAVLPLGVSTAACGLFQKDLLGLRLPAGQAPSAGETVLVWGGSTSVGSNAIQLAVAAGYDVITTASPRNFEYVQRLGARQAFDYRSSTVVADITAALRGRRLAGAIAIGTGSAAPCLDIVHRADGRKVLATASQAVSFEGLAGKRARLPRMVPLLLRVAGAQAALMIKARSRGIRTKAIWGGTLKDNEVGPAIYADYLPKALADGSYVPAPDPLIAGIGLESVQAGFDAQIRGVSARKVVITL
jgi:NADPH:quinone reductase-like Zn-dependent oxidoreductase